LSDTRDHPPIVPQRLRRARLSRAAARGRLPASRA